MGVRYPQVSSTVIANAMPATITETVLCILPPINISLDFAQIIIQWFASILMPGNGGNMNMRLRRGTTTAGAIVGNGPYLVTAAASTTVLLSQVYVDTPGAVAAQQYCLTCATIGNNVAGTLNDVCMLAYAL
jgi:hypothetical protein